MTLNPPLLRLIGAAALALACVACGPSVPERLRIAVDAQPSANQDSPVAVAVLVVYEDRVFAELSKLSASDWFEQSEQRQRDNPDGRDFDFIEWEVMPGQQVPETNMELAGVPAEGLIFADYFAEGDHRVRFNPMKRIVLVLETNDFAVIDRREE